MNLQLMMDANSTDVDDTGMDFGVDNTTSNVIQYLDPSVLDQLLLDDQSERDAAMNIFAESKAPHPERSIYLEYITGEDEDAFQDCLTGTNDSLCALEATNKLQPRKTIQPHRLEKLTQKSG